MEFSEEFVGRIWDEKDFPKDIVYDPYQNSVVSRVISPVFLGFSILLKKSFETLDRQGVGFFFG